MKSLFTIILLFLCFGQSAGQKCEVDSGFRGNRFLISYYKQQHLVKPISNTNELPTGIKERLYSYLNNKLGESFAKRLRFVSGNHLNLLGLKKEFPSLYEQNLKLGAYDLLFYFSDKSKGLKSYYSKIALNEDGSINEEISLPDIGSEQSKGEIISCKKATRIAEKNSFPRKFQSITFEYSFKQKVFTWVITDNRMVEPDKGVKPLALINIGQGIYRRIEIYANSGEVLETYKYTIII